MKEIILVDNKDIKIDVVMIGSTVLTTSSKPTRSIEEWTPAYEKRCDHWKKIAKARRADLKK